MVDVFLVLLRGNNVCLGYKYNVFWIIIGLDCIVFWLYDGKNVYLE